MAAFDGPQGAIVSLFWSAPGAPSSITAVDGTVLAPVSPASLTINGIASCSVWAIPQKYLNDANFKAQLGVALFPFQAPVLASGPLPASMIPPNPARGYWGVPASGDGPAKVYCTNAVRPSVPAGFFCYNVDTGRLLQQTGVAGWQDYGTGAPA
jgi:hypothetical protein